MTYKVNLNEVKNNPGRLHDNTSEFDIDESTGPNRNVGRVDEI